jgi:hypothetical protein
MELDRDLTEDDVGPFQCANCGVLSDSLASGWRASRSEDREVSGPPTLEILCPDCSEVDFSDD